MRHYPAFLELRGRAVLLLGAGEALAAKRDLVRAAGALPREAERFAPALLDGAALAIASGAPEADLRALHAAAVARGIPVNVVDRPELCSFITPAIIRRDEVTVAVSTGGAAPVLARLLRQRIEVALPPLVGRVAAMGGRFSAAVRARIPALPARRAFLQRAFQGAPGQLAEAGRQIEAEAAFAAMLDDADARPGGFVHVVGTGPGAPDLLTLRALRALGEADVVAHDPAVPEAILDLARRDARRLPLAAGGEAAAAALAALAREGLRVVRVLAGDPLVFGRGGEEVVALREGGIPHEVVPGVTAALACAAQAGIPLTHGEAARVLTLVAGDARDDVLDLDFRALARTGQTLCVYMALETIGALHQGLLWEGYDDATPGILLECGGTPAQRELRGTLAELVENAPGWAGDGPVLLILGEAVAMGAHPLLPEPPLPVSAGARTL